MNEIGPEHCPTCGAETPDGRPVGLTVEQAVCGDGYHNATPERFATLGARQIKEAGSGGAVMRWGDVQQYYAEPMPEGAGATGPRVTLLNATPDPLGSLAAVSAIYSGRVVRSLAEITDDERQSALEAMLATELQGPLEVASFHFLIEGVTRSFTHQMVRQREAFFAQESLRFAVKEFWTSEVPMPPSVAARPDAKLIWEQALQDADHGYQRLVNSGIPAEEARGLLPHAVTTRLHWVLDLRSLLHVAGLRTCTQAEFHWRIVMARVAEALRACQLYRPNGTYRAFNEGLGSTFPHHDGWQFALIADHIRPVCYQKGRCGFMAKFDRGCTIRERVEVRANNGGKDPGQWHKPFVYYEHNPPKGEVPGVRTSPGIEPAEWAADPAAARRRDDLD